MSRSIANETKYLLAKKILLDLYKQNLLTTDELAEVTLELGKIWKMKPEYEKSNDKSQN